MVWQLFQARGAMLGRWGRALWGSAPLLLALSAFVWCTNTVTVRGLGASVLPMQLAFVRMAVATLMLLAVAGPRIVADRGVLARHAGLMLLLGATGIGGFNLLVYIGLQTTTALHGLLLQSIIPVVILVVVAVLYGEWPGVPQVAAIVVSMAGVAVIVAQGSVDNLLRLQVSRGDAWVLAGMLAYGVYSALLRRRPPLHPMSFLFGSFAGATLVLAGPAAWEAAATGTMRWTWFLALVTLYLAAGPAILAYLGYNRGVALIGPSRAGQYVHLIPVFGSLLAVFFLGEAFRPYLVVGILLIALGLFLARGTGARRPALGGASSPST